MLIVKIVLLAVICSVINIPVRQIRPEFSPFVQVSSVIILLSVSLNSIRALLDRLDTFSQSTDSFVIDSAFTLFKVLSIAFGTKLASEMCKDNGNASLSVCVELAGKVIIILMCFPLVETIFKLSLRFVE